MFPIRNDADLERALARIEELWNAHAGTAEADEREVFETLVEAYESQHSTLLPSDPIEVIQYKLQELGISQREFGRRLGWASAGRVSEILNRRRPLTLTIIRQVAEALGIPPAALLGGAAQGGEDAAWVEIAADLAERASSAADRKGCTLAEWVHAALEQCLAHSVEVRPTTTACAAPRSHHVRLVSPTDATNPVPACVPVNDIAGDEMELAL